MKIAGTLSGSKYEKLTTSTKFSDLDDSVGNLEIVILCEEDFGIEIPDEDAERLLTVRQFTDYIFEKLHSRLPETNT